MFFIQRCYRGKYFFYTFFGKPIEPDLYKPRLNGRQQTRIGRCYEYDRDPRSGETRIEMMDRVFFERVREGYLALAHQEPERIAVIDANKGVGEIHEQIRDDFFRWAGIRRNSRLKIKDSR